jgi:hypothetical protein
MISAGAVVSPYSARMVTLDSRNDFSGQGRGACDDVDDISAVPDTVHTGLRRPSPGADSRADRTSTEYSLWESMVSLLAE